MNLKNLFNVVLLGAVCLLVVNGYADSTLCLSRLFSDHMVLQAGAETPVWGWAEPGSSVIVEFAGQKKIALANEDGKWVVTLDPMSASPEPQELQVSSFQFQVSVSDVLVGEVWLASGQSNMGFQMRKSASYEDAMKHASDREVRFFKVPQRFSAEPLDRLEGGEWVICTATNLAELSATAYYFADALGKELNTPIAIIQSAWGGTPGQNWTPYEALKADHELASYVEERDQGLAALSAEEKTPAGLEQVEDKFLAFIRELKKFNKTKEGERPVPPEKIRPRLSATLTYNAMIHPLVPYGIKGAIWYQGEANTGTPENAALYGRMLLSMIGSWRERWDDDFPFLLAQLPEYIPAGREENWIQLREQQRRVAANVDNTAMVVTIGHGNLKDIHPTHKKPVGELLAKAALNKAYSKDALWCGPAIRTATLQDDQVVLSFDSIGQGLDGKTAPLSGFEVSPDGNEFTPVPAVIDGETVSIVVTMPVRFVRYGWDVNPSLTLYNRDGFPASPFQVEVNP